MPGRCGREQAALGQIAEEQFDAGVVLHGPFGDEPIARREAVLEAMRGVGTEASEHTIWWRSIPTGIAMQNHLAGLVGMQSWELLANAE